MLFVGVIARECAESSLSREGYRYISPLASISPHVASSAILSMADTPASISSHYQDHDTENIADTEGLPPTDSWLRRYRGRA